MDGLFGDQETGLLGDQDYTPQQDMQPESIVVQAVVTNGTMEESEKVYQSNNIVVF